MLLACDRGKINSVLPEAIVLHKQCAIFVLCYGQSPGLYCSLLVLAGCVRIYSDRLVKCVKAIS